MLPNLAQPDQPNFSIVSSPEPNFALRSYSEVMTRIKIDPRGISFSPNAFSASQPKCEISVLPGFPFDPG